MTKMSMVSVGELVWFSGGTDAEPLNRFGVVVGWLEASQHRNYRVLLLPILHSKKRDILWTCREDVSVTSVQF